MPDAGAYLQVVEPEQQGAETFSRGRNEVSAQLPAPDQIK
jgi:hypothetical protein